MPVTMYKARDGRILATLDEAQRHERWLDWRTVCMASDLTEADAERLWAARDRLLAVLVSDASLRVVEDARPRDDHDRGTTGAVVR